MLAVQRDDPLIASRVVICEYTMFLNEREAASELRIDRRTLRRMIRDGRLPAIDVGSGKRRHYRLETASLAKIAARDKAGVPTEQPIPPKNRNISRPQPQPVQRYFPDA